MGLDRSPATSPSGQRATRSNPRNEYCRICKKEVKQNDIKLLCNVCKIYHHIDCAGVSQKFYQYYIETKKVQWHCYLCDTEIRTQNMESINKIHTLVSNVSTEIEKIKQHNSSWKQELKVEVMDQIKEEVGKQVSKFNIPQNDHYNRRKNLIINGVPKQENENIEMIVENIAQLISYKQKFWLDNCFRISKKSATANQGPENILVKFTTELNRDNFMQLYMHYIKRNNLTPSKIGLPGDRRVFVNEHLSEELHGIMKEALLMKKNGKLLKVHAHSSHVMVKHGKGWEKIRNVAQLKSLHSRHK